MVTVNLTNRCNQHCIYCEIGTSPSSTNSDTLTITDLKWVIDEMYINGIRKISLCGGEPFLFEGIFDVVAYAGMKNIRCSITTNGMNGYLLNDMQLKTLKDWKTEINISVDSFNEQVNAYTRGSAVALQNALKSINRLTEKGIPVTVLTVISKFNCEDLSGFLKDAHERGIKQVLFQPVIYYSNYPERPPVDEKGKLNAGIDKLDIMMDELGKILRYERNHSIKTNVYRIFPWIRYYLQTAASQNKGWFFDAVLKKFFCREVYAIIDINYNGGIQPCGLSPASVSIINNKQSGLISLWLQATEQIRQDLQKEHYYDCCNGCCHHFSRNMMASIMKHPVKNRIAFIHIAPFLWLRIQNNILKKIIKNRR